MWEDAGDQEFDSIEEVLEQINIQNDINAAQQEVIFNYQRGEIELEECFDLMPREIQDLIIWNPYARRYFEKKFHQRSAIMRSRRKELMDRKRYGPADEW